jgi:hypothetical protein
MLTTDLQEPQFYGEASHVMHFDVQWVPSWDRKDSQPERASRDEAGRESSVRFLLLHSLQATNTFPGT